MGAETERDTEGERQVSGATPLSGIGLYYQDETAPRVGKRKQIDSWVVTVRETPGLVRVVAEVATEQMADVLVAYLT